MGVPRVVLDHYKNPRNKRAIASPSAKGFIASRKDGEGLTIFLEVKGGRVTDASFVNTADRMDDPGASALTELVKGKTVAEVQRLGVEDVARSLESAASPGIAIVAPAAHRVALFALAGERAPPLGRTICNCFHVPEDRIRRYVREKRLATVDDVRTWTRANSGCRSCRPDIEQIISEELRS